MARTKAERRREGETARQRAAQLRAEHARRERRRRLLIIVGATLGTLAVVGVIVVAGLAANNSSSKKSLPDRSPAPTSVVTAVTGVPAATLNSVGVGAGTSHPKAVSDAALASAGKPEVLYVGAEYCPYCAAGRWALVQALSRFGTFSNLSLTHSASSPESFPQTPSFTFHGASYTSDTISFAGRELATRTFKQLESLPADEAALWHRYTGAQGSFPFLDVGGHYVEVGQSVAPSVLMGLTATQIAKRMANPSDSVAKAVDGTANVLTAAICRATGGAPAAVCTAPGVTAAGKALGG